MFGRSSREVMPSDSDRQVGSFYGVTHNPVRTEIAHLRALRDAGRLGAADYAVRVSALINGHAVSVDLT